jgi:isopenicillin-N epimerase
VAALINADSKDVVLVENASSAVNGILRSIGLSRGEGVLVLSTAYNMVCETLCWLETTAGIQQVVVPMLFPLEGPERIV